VKFDYHTHHERCGHAFGSIEDYIREAIRHDLQIIGISDHSPFFADEHDHPNPHIAMARSEFANYCAEVLRLKEKYAGRIEVLLGVESDFYPEHVELYRSIYAPLPFDYIIGSVHSIRGVGVFNKHRWIDQTETEKVAIKDEYLDYIRQSAKAGLFQIIGHMDAMKSYYPAYRDLPSKQLDDTLQTIAAHGLAIEINTSFKEKKTRWPLELREAFQDDTAWYPADDVLERACHYGVRVTFGSDSHHPQRIADDFDRVQAKLKEVGFREWTIFRARHPVHVPL
jgi:histidinol-phosphatase (PHP family)